MNGNEHIERRHQSDFKTRRIDIKKWSETWGAFVVAITVTAGLITGAYAFYQSQFRDPHVLKLIDDKITENNRPIYDAIKVTNDKMNENVETSDRILYLLLQHLSPGEKARGSADYNYYKGKREAP
jgi:hypothetical protein